MRERDMTPLWLVLLLFAIHIHEACRTYGLSLAPARALEGVSLAALTMGVLKIATTSTGCLQSLRKFLIYFRGLGLLGAGLVALAVSMFDTMG